MPLVGRSTHALKARKRIVAERSIALDGIASITPGIQKSYQLIAIRHNKKIYRQ